MKKHTAIYLLCAACALAGACPASAATSGGYVPPPGQQGGAQVWGTQDLEGSNIERRAHTETWRDSNGDIITSVVPPPPPAQPQQWNGPIYVTPWVSPDGNYSGGGQGGIYPGGPIPGIPGPGGQYPGRPYPGGQYPGGSHMGGQYPGQYPGRPVPGGQYPGGGYHGNPGAQYPGGPNGGYPGGRPSENHPGSQYQGGPRPGHQQPAGGSNAPRPGQRPGTPQSGGQFGGSQSGGSQFGSSGGNWQQDPYFNSNPHPGGPSWPTDGPQQGYGSSQRQNTDSQQPAYNNYNYGNQGYGGQRYGQGYNSQEYGGYAPPTINQRANEEADILADEQQWRQQGDPQYMQENMPPMEGQPFGNPRQGYGQQNSGQPGYAGQAQQPMQQRAPQPEQPTVMPGGEAPPAVPYSTIAPNTSAGER